MSEVKEEQLAATEEAAVANKAVDSENERQVEEDEGVEEGEEAIDDAEEEEEADREGGFALLGKFSREVMDMLSQINDPLPEEERDPKPLPAGGKDYKDVIRLLQVSSYAS